MSCWFVFIVSTRDGCQASDSEDGPDPLPVPYRYNISGNRADLHTVFKPTALTAEEGQNKAVRRGSELCTSRILNIENCAGQAHWERCLWGKWTS